MLTFIHELTSNGITQLQGLLKQNGSIRTPEDVQNIITVSQVISQQIDLSWQKIHQLLDAGEEGRRLRFLLLEFRDAVKLAAVGLSRVRNKVENESPSFEGKEGGLLVLAEAANRVEKIHEELASLISWLPDSPPPVDLPSIAGAGAVETAEGYVSLDDLLARERSGLSAPKGR